MIIGTHTPAELAVGQPLFFSNPESETNRQDMTLKMSTDGGLRWSRVLRIQNGSACYSSLVQFADGSLGLQFDDGGKGPVVHSPVTNETFMRIALHKAVGNGRG